MNIESLTFEKDTDEEEQPPSFIEKLTRWCPECGDAAYRKNDGFICFKCGWEGKDEK